MNSRRSDRRSSPDEDSVKIYSIRQEAQRESKPSKWTWTIPLGILVLLAGLYFIWPGYRGFMDEAYHALASGKQERVEQWVSSFGMWGYLVVLVLMLIQTLLAFLPSLLIMSVSVLAFGPVVGGLLAWTGLLMAACLGYGIGRSFGPVTLDRLVGTAARHKMKRFVDRYGVWAIIAARISPVLSTDAVSIAAGLSRMRFLHFIVATAVGTLPLTVLVAWLGADIERLKTGLIWISVASLVAFVGYVLYDRRKHQLKSED